MARLSPARRGSHSKSSIIVTTTTIASFLLAAATSCSAAVVGRGGRRAAFLHAVRPSFSPPQTTSRLRHFAYTTAGFRDSPGESNGKHQNEEGGSDVDRWERMWEQGELDRNIKKALDTTPPAPSYSTTTRSEVRVVSFDLDNTLWRTGEVISHANDVLSQYLEKRGVAVPVRTEVIMGELFKKNPGRYCPLEEFANNDTNEEGGGAAGVVEEDAAPDFDKAAGGEAGSINKNVHISSGPAKPVLLTQLRIDALRDIFVRYNSFPPEEAEVAAREAFKIWTKARHDAIPNHYAEGVIEALERLRQIESSTGKKVVLGAITDGNSDPRTVDELAPYFDFVVNSESVGVAKPDSRVYLAAAEELLNHPHLEDVFVEAMGACKFEDDAVEKTDLLETAIGPWWTHVGDDFMKDVVAARELGMRTVWCRELVMKTAGGSDAEKESAAKQLNEGKKKKRDVADLVKELATMKVVEMSIGADEFLADSIHREFADEIVDEFASIGPLLHDWHSDGLSILDDKSSDKASEESFGDTESIAANVPVPEPSIEEPKADSTISTDTKYCVYCGTKLVREANFCSLCGERQPKLS